MLVSLPGYVSDIQLDKGVGVLLWGNLPQFLAHSFMESAVRLHAQPTLDLDFTLDRGRIVLINRKSNGAARIRLRFLGEAWDVTLSDPGTQIGIDLFSRYTPDIPLLEE